MADEQTYGFLAREVKRIAQAVKDSERRIRNEINRGKGQGPGTIHNTAGKLVTELTRKGKAKFAEHFIDTENGGLGEPTGDEYDCIDIQLLSAIVSPLPVGTVVKFCWMGCWVLDDFDCDQEID